ncbi:DUF1800 domain-containing protein [Pseudohongiella acticola]|jgi:uncharacterized protein (DUF1800 family)|uniref:DUF1800 domain-containing protein n=1 Tax=Pseudohongiella acticola TaxID=1524254 RepID=UPI0030EB9B23
MAVYSPFIAANKLGLGLQPGELGEIGKDPRGWLIGQLPKASRLPPRYEGLAHSSQLIEEGGKNYLERRNILGVKKFTNEVKQKLAAIQARESELLRMQANHRLAVAIESDTPFTERLVRFWSNHFSISATSNKPTIHYAGLAYENEAIRANMTGSFADMLIGVASHPVMLFYLDNTNSIGPNSPAGLQRNLGLNENYAREMLELHTLGVSGGYTQSDVIALAKMLTGWTVNLSAEYKALPNPSEAAGTFLYLQYAHEPGTQQLLGRSYSAPDWQQAVAAMRDLALHPSTATFIAEKLVRHFISDNPPASAVARLAKRFTETRGDLPSVHQALVEMDETWDSGWQKLKSPEDYVVSSIRALPGVPLSDGVLKVLNDSLASFNQMPFTAASPAGWPEQAEHWGGPDALIKRVEYINMVAGAVGRDFDARDLVAQILPENADLETAVRRSESKTQALTLLLASPQFQWRA